MMSETVKKDTCSAHVCPHKMAFMLDNWLRKLVQNPRKIVGEYINEGDTVIDFGCGPGFFSIEMAKMVGDGGKVIAADLQEEMLTHVRKKAAAKNLSHRVDYHRCGQDNVGLRLEKKADFMLAFYMLHETPSPAAFLEEVKGLLKEGGKFLVVEPRMHVNREMYEEMISRAKEAGFNVMGTPQKKGGRSVLLTPAARGA
ncbi:MAG: class I SAM-dependent methyltransferase [bacterium]|nr:class I SAM-dependent methyltransferase [bacterium]